MQASPRPDLPIVWSEYNASNMAEPAVTDSPFKGPWLSNNIRLCDGLTTAGLFKQPFYGGFGLIAEDRIPKAAFNAFRLLHTLGNQRIPVASTNALATRDADGQLPIAGRDGPNRPRIRIVDAQHGSLLAAWEAMGSPRSPRAVKSSFFAMLPCCRMP